MALGQSKLLCQRLGLHLDSLRQRASPCRHPFIRLANEMQIIFVMPTVMPVTAINVSLATAQSFKTACLPPLDELRHRIPRRHPRICSRVLVHPGQEILHWTAYRS